MNKGIQKSMSGKILLFSFFILSFTVFTTGIVSGQEKAVSGDLLAPYVPTPMNVVNRMLELAKITPEDLVYDLGCGDGRMLITAAKKYGARCVGVEIDKDLVLLAIENAKKEKVDHLITIIHEDALKIDMSPASVLAFYLLPEGLRKLKPIFEESLKPGTRLVSHNYPIEGWSPDKIEYMEADDNFEHLVYFFTVKEKKREKK